MRKYSPNRKYRTPPSMRLLPKKHSNKKQTPTSKPILNFFTKLIETFKKTNS